MIELKTEAQAALEIVQTAKLLHQKNFLAAGDGNLSYRIDQNHILITPKAKHKAFIKPNELAVINLSGKILKGQPSSEMLMHLEVYKSQPLAKAVIHAHPPHAIAWTIARPDLTELPKEPLSELILAVGSIPIVPFALPGTQDMATNLKPYIANNRVMILARHGALSWGEDLSEAYNGMERLEHTALILYLAQSLGGLTTLSHQHILDLQTIRDKIGPKTF